MCFCGGVGSSVEGMDQALEPLVRFMAANNGGVRIPSKSRYLEN